MKKQTPHKPLPKSVKWLWGIVFAPFALLLLLLLLTAAGLFGPAAVVRGAGEPQEQPGHRDSLFGRQGTGHVLVQNRSYVQYDELFPLDSAQLLRLDGYDDAARSSRPWSRNQDVRYRGTLGHRPDVAGTRRRQDRPDAEHLAGRRQYDHPAISQNLFPRHQREPGKIARTTKLVVSKLKEWITALKLEYNYTKEEIAAMYLNTVEFGSNAYGIKSAAHTFFNKEPHELNIQEAALLAGLVKGPTMYSPRRNPENALARRNLVLDRMASAGAITRHQRDSIAALPILLNYKPVSHNEGPATYFREMLRLTMNAERPKRRQFQNDWDYEQAVKEYDENPIYGWCLKNTKADGTPYDIYRDGLKIYTTIDSRMQEYAEQAIQKQMESVIQPQMDAQFKRTKTLFIDADRQERERIMRNAIRYSDRYYQMQKAGVDEKTILASFDKPCPMKIFTYKGERDTVLTPRDSILHHKRIMRASFVAMDPRSGYVKAYVGGPNFRYFKYDMAKQGKRQIGSTIKPFVYTFAIDHLGLSPCTPVPNLPVTIETANGVPWSPKEAGKVEQNGELHPLSWGLARSRNNYSAWIMKQAKQPQAVANFIHNMGIHSYIDPVPALCLGTSESNVYEMVSAFSTFANEGVYTTPIFVTRIEDRQGNLIASFAPRTQDAISEHTAYTMLTMLEGVIRSGTGGRLGWAYNMQNVEVGGKTGTSQKNRDAWFMCVLPKLVAGCWVGGEDQAVRLVSRGEGSVIALPIVGEFLNRIYADPSTGISKQDLFTRPAVMPVYDCDETEKTDDSATRYEEDEFFE